MEIVLLSKAHDRSGFDCGEAGLNDYLQRFARQNDEKNLGRTYVAVVEARVEGYYTLAGGSLTFDTVPEKLPQYPIPVVHLARLAVNRRAQGKGLETLLLMDALRRSVQVSEQIGIYAVTVDALNESARSFYLKYGFTELRDDPFPLYLTTKRIRKLVV